ncbi:hypothetical protein NLB65_00635 [Candidatus Aminicenantes bacterium AC-335-B20]|jgi:hypothetical protein|nr:hypothetical protein [SCandidatus Aminicenantes bacterium Aminicenantia_JdfR_composite]MCP2598949.1 hypothetical protein [Candidatus Aminicenantes bacterium AC-335-B20]
MKWYIKLALVFIAIIGLVIGFIIYDRLTSGKIIYKTIIDGTQYKQQVLKFNIEQPKLTHVLIINPSIESGWGDPDVFIIATLTDPQNNNLVTIGRDIVFGGIKPSPAYQRSYSDYREKFPFKPTLVGEYTFKLTVLTEHVKDVYIAVGRKGK